ncbi:Uncharacterised protein [Bordetella pertussis]|nr:Uncharacterised protein [Bordetella pertussis]CFT91526.1 Uncharacterised protein [Bordetella pertussis]
MPLFSALSALRACASAAGSGSATGAGCWNTASIWRRLNSSLAAATYRSSARANPSPWANCSRLTAVLPSRCSSFSTSACPWVMRCCSSMALNHMRTLARARGLAR